MNKYKNRFIDLVNYPNKLDEIMNVHDDFNTNKFEIINGNQKGVALNIGVDDENPNEHILKAYINFDRIHNPKLPELIYYFRILNDKNQFLPGTLYSRIKSKPYIPKDADSKITDKINLMFNELIKMDKPNEFVMATYEKLSGNSLLRFEKLVKHIESIGYRLAKSGINLEGKHFWVFSLNINESTTDFDITKLIDRTDEDWDRITNLIK